MIVSSVQVSFSSSMDGEGDTVFGIVGVRCVVEDSFVTPDLGAVVVVVLADIAVVVGGAVTVGNLRLWVLFASAVFSMVVISAVGDVD